MKVQELIDKLQEFKDKEADIKLAFYAESEEEHRTIYASIDSVEEEAPLYLGYKCALIYSE